MRRLLRSVIAGVFVCVACASARADLVTLTKIGSPTWQPVGATLFSAPGALDLAGLDQTALAILGSKYVVNPTNNQLISAGGNPGPYDTEIPVGVTAAGFKLGPDFNADDFSGGHGVLLGFMLVPAAGAPTGTSPDFSSGPIIPNSLFPLTHTGDTTRNGVDFDPNWDFTLGNVNQIYQQGSTAPNFDGFSHIPFFDAEAFEYGPGTGPAGDYSSTFNLLDTQGNGWTLTTSYTVVPEPASGLIGGSALLLALAKRRRV